MEKFGKDGKIFTFNVSSLRESIFYFRATKAIRTFPELPAISRCHSYRIECKYTYACSNETCGVR